MGGVGEAAIGWHWIFGVLLDRFGPMRPILSTMALAIVGILLMLLLVRPSASVWMICVGYIAYMVGFSMAYANTMTAGMSVIPASMQPDVQHVPTARRRRWHNGHVDLPGGWRKAVTASRRTRPRSRRPCSVVAMWPSLCCWLCSSARSWRISAHSPRAERRDN